ncbi:outer membrane receptor protein involved in Fe transport [Sphingomonas zeicaulis]|uniref:TonB-dependent receptor domain-containing protein n=1 Tax=Sphingomonas zeicaulis TaxID=1632740 RepID=UPI003D19F905
MAQTAEQDYHMAEQDLAAALGEVARRADVELFASDDLLAGLRAKPLIGRMSAAAAIARLLEGTGLRAERREGAFVIVRAPQSLAGREDDPITVTGTRIRGSVPVGAPLVSIDRAAIDRSGYATTQQVLQSLPQNFGGGQNEATFGIGTRNNAGTNNGYGASINLRGLGTSSTLVLFDGNRPALGGLGGVFADLSMVPSSAIERIEVLTDGASAIYGTDAVAGVVNLRFRDRFEGAETRLRAGTADGDFGEIQASQIVGRRWSGGQVVLAYEYYDRGRLSGRKRAFATEDLRPFGGPDYRLGYSNPGTIIAADGQQFAIPTMQDGRSLQAADLVPGAANLRDARAAVDILPQQRTHSVFSAVHQELGDTISFRGSLLWARRRFDRITPAETLNALTVPVTNPFYVDPIGTAQPVQILYSFDRDLGPQINRGTVKGLTGSAGLEKFLGPWRIEASGSLGIQREVTFDLNLPNSARVAAALADPDPETALNPFGDGSYSNADTLARIRGGRRTLNRIEILGGALRADGPLFRLPGGSVRFAFGTEFRRERYRSEAISDVNTLEPTVNRREEVPNGREVVAGYGELLLPLIGGDLVLPGARELDLSVAARIEDYSDVGTTTNPRVGLRWVPLEGVTVRGSYGTSFRAPGFEELIGPAISLYQATRVPDPRSPTGQSTVLALFGYAPGIGPEKATSWTVGVDLRPVALPGAYLSANYIDVRYRDRIGSVSEDYFNFLVRPDIYGGVIDFAPSPDVIAAYYAAPTFSNPGSIPQSEITAILDGQIRNLGSIHQRGIDFDLGYATRFAGGQLDLGVAGSRILSIDRRLTETSPAVDIVGTFSNPVKLRLRGRAGWQAGQFDVSGFINYIDAYTNTVLAEPERVESWTTVDLQIGATVAVGGGDRSLRLTLNLNNALDANPPYVNNRTYSSAVGYDPDNASAVGRLIAFQVITKW